MKSLQVKFKMEVMAKGQDFWKEHIFTKMVNAPQVKVDDKNSMIAYKLTKHNIQKQKLQNSQINIENKQQNPQSQLKKSKVQQIRWNLAENIGYIKFLKENGDLFLSEGTRRAGKVFLQLSKALRGLKTPNQCKSHHQKMQKVTETGSIEEVIEYLQNKHPKLKDNQDLLKLFAKKNPDSLNIITQSIHQQAITTPFGLQIKIFIKNDLIEKW